MSVDLEKLAKQIDEALAKETPESLTKWLNERRQNAETGEKQCNLPVVNGWHLFSEQKPTEGDNIEVYYDDRTIVNVDWQDYLYNDKEFKHMRFWRDCR